VRRRRLLSLPFAACAVLACAPARADVSSWLAVGGGATGQLAQGSTVPGYAGAFTWSMGVGTSPRDAFVAGVTYRGATYFGLGTDLGAGVRLATGGFARGGWGLALDATPLYRTWGGGSYGTWPVQGVLTLGAPWGLQLALGAQAWDMAGGDPARGAFAAIELDLLRLTVMRQGPSERWWPNPNPAGGHERQVGLLAW
jgi:hypothetical protein